MYKKFITVSTPVLLGGGFMGIITTIYAIMSATLLFSGKLATFLGDGIAMMLIGHVLMCLFIAFYSPLTGEIGSFKNPPAIVLLGMINNLILSNLDIIAMNYLF